MGFNFSFFGSQEHRVFNYKPRYYDPEKEALKEKFGHVDGTLEKEEYVPGAYIKGSFRDGKYQKTKDYCYYNEYVITKIRRHNLLFLNFCAKIQQKIG